MLPTRDDPLATHFARLGEHNRALGCDASREHSAMARPAQWLFLAENALQLFDLVDLSRSTGVIIAQLGLRPGRPSRAKYFQTCLGNRAQFRNYRKFEHIF